MKAPIPSMMRSEVSREVMGTRLRPAAFLASSCAVLSLEEERLEVTTAAVGVDELGQRDPPCAKPRAYHRGGGGGSALDAPRAGGLA